MIDNEIHFDETRRLKELFVGRSVRRVDRDILQLDDETRLRVVPNRGCGGCSAGNYSLVELGECENIITNVEVSRETISDPEFPEKGSYRYRLFVYAENRRVNLATFEGDDGNGYYGTGFWLEIEDGEEPG